MSTAPINQVYDVADALKANGNIISVGYMLRYLRAVQKMKQIIHDNGLTVMATNARYVSHPRLVACGMTAPRRLTLQIELSPGVLATASERSQLR